MLAGTLGMADENVRVAITLSKYDYLRLKKWALIHGRQPATFAAQIIAARLEANSQWINENFSDYARFLGVSAEELEQSLSKDD